MTAEEIFRWVSTARRGNRAYFSNAFYTVTQLQQFLEEKDVRVLPGEDAILLLERDDGLYRLQFFAKNAEALRRPLEELPPLDGPLVADLPGREPGVSGQAEQLEALGFEPYSVFVRMVCKERLMPSDRGADRVEPAREEDASAVLGMIGATFDPLFAHIPTESEIAEAIRRGEITVIRDPEGIAGMAYFEKQSDTYYVLRYFIVDGRCRGQNIGGALMYRHFSSTPPETVYMLWVGTYNSAQSLYQKFGFQYDGLTDHILKYGGNNHGKDL